MEFHRDSGAWMVPCERSRSHSNSAGEALQDADRQHTHTELALETVAAWLDTVNYKLFATLRVATMPHKISRGLRSLLGHALAHLPNSTPEECNPQLRHAKTQSPRQQAKSPKPQHESRRHPRYNTKPTNGILHPILKRRTLNPNPRIEN